MTCPCCERNARLETSDEYDARTGDSLSGDVAIASQDIMIERCRGAENGSRTAENRDGRRHLRAVSSGSLVAEPARAVSEIERSAQLAGKASGFAIKLLRLTREIQLGCDMDADRIAALHAEAFAWLNGGEAPAGTRHFKQAAE